MALALAAIALLAGGCGSEPGTVATTAKLPELDGWWIWDYLATNDFPVGGLPGQLPAKPEVLEELAQALRDTGAMFERAMASNASYEDGARLTAFLAQDYCVPATFIGSLANEGAVEFLTTPGRITVLGETGLVRRIALDQPLPAEPLESNAGTSVGHWQGHTLIVETTGFNSAAHLNGQEIGRGVHSVERIWLKEPDVLQIDLTLSVPKLFSAPYEHSYVFRRDRDHQFADASFCKSNDRSVDPVTRKDRLDLTPPHDLPPPPKD